MSLSLRKGPLRKKPIVDFVKERSLNLGFMANNGNELQKDNFNQHVKTFLEAYVDPRVESYTRIRGSSRSTGDYKGSSDSWSSKGSMHFKPRRHHS